MKNYLKKILLKLAGESVGITGMIEVFEYKKGTKELTQYIKSKNIVMTGNNTGRDLLVQWLLTWYYNANPSLGIIPVTPGINYIAIGTGTATPALTDTQLQTEVNRAIISYAADLTNNQALIQALFPDGILTTGTVVTEIGSFIGGTASANTGDIFNHGLLGTPYTKSSGTDTTIQITFTFN